MNTILLILLILIVLMTMSRTEMFTEQFGLSGYTKPMNSVLLKDTEMIYLNTKNQVKKLKYPMISCKKWFSQRTKKFPKKLVFVRILLKHYL